MNATIEQLLTTIELGTAQEYQDLTVIPLLGHSQSHLDYVSLGDALDQGGLTITEVSMSGSVPELAVENTGALPVLLIDGEELVGAKQNRMLNISVMVAAKSRLVLPVTCT